MLSSLIFNNVKGIIKNCAISVPGFGSLSDDLISDFSIMSGSTLVNEDNVNGLGEFRLEDLGK